MTRLAILAVVLAAVAVAAAGFGPTSRPPHIPEVPGIWVLFDGTSWDGWQTRDGKPSEWEIQPDGSVKAGPGDAISKYQFLNYQLHLEFLCPVMPEKKGQARANSGVYLQGIYEVQVLDSFGEETRANGCGAVYSIAPPAVNASRPPGEWQSYDIIYHAAVYDEVDALVSNPRLTVIHNGIVIHDDIELPKHTPGGLEPDFRPMGPLLLQDHGDPVRYRNIWTRPLPR